MANTAKDSYNNSVKRYVISKDFSDLPSTYASGIIPRGSIANKPADNNFTLLYHTHKSSSDVNTNSDNLMSSVPLLAKHYTNRNPTDNQCCSRSIVYDFETIRKDNNGSNDDDDIISNDVFLLADEYNCLFNTSSDFPNGCKTFCIINAINAEIPPNQHRLAIESVTSNYVKSFLVQESPLIPVCHASSVINLNNIPYYLYTLSKHDNLEHICDFHKIQQLYWTVKGILNQTFKYKQKKWTPKLLETSTKYACDHRTSQISIGVVSIPSEEAARKAYLASNFSFNAALPLRFIPDHAGLKFWLNMATLRPGDQLRGDKRPKATYIVALFIQSDQLCEHLTVINHNSQHHRSKFVIIDYESVDIVFKDLHGFYFVKCKKHKCVNELSSFNIAEFTELPKANVLPKFIINNSHLNLPEVPLVTTALLCVKAKSNLITPVIIVDELNSVIFDTVLKL